MADSKAADQAADTDGNANSTRSLLPKAEKEVSRVWNRGAKAQIRTSFGGGPSLKAPKRRAGVAFFDVDEVPSISSPDGQQASSKVTLSPDDVERRPLADSDALNTSKLKHIPENRVSLEPELEPTHSLVEALSSAGLPDDTPVPRTESPSEPDKKSESARSSLSEGEIEESESDHSQILINYASAEEQETDDVIAKHSDSNKTHKTLGGVDTRLHNMGHVTSLLESDQKSEWNGTDRHSNGTPGSGLTLDKLPLAYQQLQHRYFPRAESDEIPLDEQLVICLVCQGTGHIGASCPKLTCSTCGAEKDHFLSACPTLQICVRCRTKGHQESACPSKLKFSKKADGNTTCSHCSSGAHFEEECPKIFQSYHVPSEASILKVDALPINCYACGSKAHYGADCSYRPRNWTEPKSGWTFSLQNMKLYLNPGSSLHSLEAPPPRANGAYYVEESTEEETLPLRTRHDQPQRKPKARINSKIHLKSSGPPASNRGRAHQHHEPQARGRERGVPSRGRGQRRPNGPGHPGPRGGAVYKPSRNDAKKAWQQFTR